MMDKKDVTAMSTLLDEKRILIGLNIETALSRARRRIFIGIRKKVLALADATFPESLTQI